MARNDAGIEERLRAALNVELSEIVEGVSMTQAAIDGRLRDACEMASLCLALNNDERRPRDGGA